MSHYYPARAQQRAVWLHNHILLARGSFAAFTRDLVRMQFDRSGTLSTWQRLIHRLVIFLNILKCLFFFFLGTAYFRKFSELPSKRVRLVLFWKMRKPSCVHAQDQSVRLGTAKVARIACEIASFVTK